MLRVASLLALAFAKDSEPQPNPPTWPETVKIFSPNDTNISNVTAEMGVKLINMTTGQFCKDRLALLFMPGTYRNVSVPVGYYTQVLGLGARADDVVFADTEMGVHSPIVPPEQKPDPGSLATFWRSVENFRNEASNGMLWAVSQAAPIRRVHVTEELRFFEDNAWASGGFMANCQVDGHTKMGGQQQWFTRNCDLNTSNASTMGTNWNLVHVGSTGSPSQRKIYDKDAQLAISNVAASPVVAEKPYISIDDGGNYSLQIPPVRRLAVGASLNDDPAKTKHWRTVPFDKVFVADAAKHNSSYIQEMIDRELHILLTPGIYHLDGTLTMGKYEGQVMLGIGLATVVAPTSGKPAVVVAPGAGDIRLAGICFQAAMIDDDSKVKNTALLVVGAKDSKVSNPITTPIVLSDIFTRVGGPLSEAGLKDPTKERKKVSVDKMVVIWADNVIGDNLWLWRADHSEYGDDEEPPEANSSAACTPQCEPTELLFHLVREAEYPAETCLEVNGDQVIMYGLFAEHASGDLTVWNGEGGQTYFYQSELPYDVSDESYCLKNYTAYRVADHVKSHQGVGMGAYTYFRDHACTIQSGFVAPEGDGIRFTNIFTKYLNGGDFKTGAKYVLNERGYPVFSQKQGLSRIASSMKYECPGADCPDQPEPPVVPRFSPQASGWITALAVLLGCVCLALAGVSYQLHRTHKALNGQSVGLASQELGANSDAQRLGA